MDIKDLYNNIQQNKISDDLIIFVNKKDNNFLAWQYTNKLSELKKLQVVIIDDLTSVSTVRNTFSDLFAPDSIQLYIVDKLDKLDIDYTNAKNLIIWCNEVTKSVEKNFSNYIINIPKLEEWQIKDFIYSQLKNFSDENITKFYELCHKDIFRINTELNRLKVYEGFDYNKLFDDFLAYGIYNDLISIDMSELAKAIASKDINRVSNLYKNLDFNEFNIFQILGLLHNLFSCLVRIYCTANSKPNTKDLTSGQYYVLHNIPNVYTSSQLQHIFLFILNFDKQIKDGNLDLSMEDQFNYLLVNIMGV